MVGAVVEPRDARYYQDVLDAGSTLRDRPSEVDYAPDRCCRGQQDCCREDEAPGGTQSLTYECRRAER